MDSKKIGQSALKPLVCILKEVGWRKSKEQLGNTHSHVLIKHKEWKNLNKEHVKRKKMVKEIGTAETHHLGDKGRIIDNN